MGTLLNTTLAIPEPELFWNTRGRSVGIYDKSSITSLLQQGFVRCGPGVKPGDYNPVYDKGDATNLDPISTKLNVPIGGGEYLRLIEC